MRRFLTFNALLGAALLLSSCWGWDKPSRPSGGNNQQQTDYHKISAAYGGAFWCGRMDGYNMDVFDVYLMDKNVKMVDANFGGVGMGVWLDMNVERNADRILESGVYTAARNNYENNAFIKGGLDKDGYITGSYIYYRTTNRSAEYFLISSGSVNVNISGSKYKITGQVVAMSATEDSGPQEFTFEYYGNFEYTDLVDPEPEPGPGPGPDPGTVFTVNGLNHGRLEYNGKCLIPVTNTNYADWSVFLGDKNMNFDDRANSTGDELDIEFITAANATDLTPGRYEIKASGVNNNSAVPGGLLEGYIDGGYYGVWYFPQNGKAGEFGATSGYAVVSKSGSIYRIEFSFVDSIGNASFSGVYSGSLEYRDATKATKGVLSQSSRRMVAVQSRPCLQKEAVNLDGRPAVGAVKLF
ncbi:MAG: hypothetical protein MJY67_00915 [Bacteroidales bacterium]|nr:hypothetical protein [Bacteroidales bacterium]